MVAFSLLVSAFFLSSVVCSRRRLAYAGTAMGWYRQGEAAGWIASVVGAVILLFIYGLVGLALGVTGGVAVGFALYFGLLRIPLRHFFTATNMLLIMLAAGLASAAARYLVQADLLPALHGELWDSSRLLSNGSLLGQTLHILIGYDATPSGIMLVFYLTVAMLLLAVGMRLIDRPAKPPPTTKPENETGV